MFIIRAQQKGRRTKRAQGKRAQSKKGAEQKGRSNNLTLLSYPVFTTDDNLNDVKLPMVGSTVFPYT